MGGGLIVVVALMMRILRLFRLIGRLIFIKLPMLSSQNNRLNGNSYNENLTIQDPASSGDVVRVTYSLHTTINYNQGIFHTTLVDENLALALLPKLDEELKPEVIHWAAFYEHRIRQGSKTIFHLEAFVAKGMVSPSPQANLVMRIIAGYLMGLF